MVMRYYCVLTVQDPSVVNEGGTLDTKACSLQLGKDNFLKVYTLEICYQEAN